MQENEKKYMELANRIYDLDTEVYDSVGSSLGRTFTGDRENTIRNLCTLMMTKPDGHLLRSELALISNMARTIKDKKKRDLMMSEYDNILKQIEELPDVFGKVDIVDLATAVLNVSAWQQRSGGGQLLM